MGTLQKSRRRTKYEAFSSSFFMTYILVVAFNTTMAINNDSSSSAHRADEETPLLRDDDNSKLQNGNGDNVQQGSSEEVVLPQEMSPRRLYIYQFLIGLGYGGMLTVTLLAVISAVDHEHQAVITSATYAFRSTGSSIGVTIASAV